MIFSYLFAVLLVLHMPESSIFHKLFNLSSLMSLFFYFMEALKARFCSSWFLFSALHSGLYLHIKLGYKKGAVLDNAKKCYKGWDEKESIKCV